MFLKIVFQRAVGRCEAVKSFRSSLVSEHGFGNQVRNHGWHRYLPKV